jgi:predicted O-methyltransferase YrrM
MNLLMNDDQFQDAWPRIAKIYGWLTVQEASLLRHFAKLAKGPIVELGAYLGRSTVVLAASSNQPFTTIDTFLGSSEHHIDGKVIDTYPAFLNRLQAFGLEEKVTVKKQDVVIAAQDFKEDSVHLLFVDADHEYQAVCDQVQAWLPKMVAGGVIILHDVGEWPGPTHVAGHLLQWGFKRQAQLGTALALAVPERVV